MLENTTFYDALIDTHARWLELTIDPTWRPTISQSLQAFSAAMQLVEAFPLPDETEPAPVFKP